MYIDMKLYLKNVQNTDIYLVSGKNYKSLFITVICSYTYVNRTFNIQNIYNLFNDCIYILQIYFNK